MDSTATAPWSLTQQLAPHLFIELNPTKNHTVLNILSRPQSPHLREVAPAAPMEALQAAPRVAQAEATVALRADLVVDTVALPADPVVATVAHHHHLQVAQAEVMAALRAEATVDRLHLQADLVDHLRLHLQVAQAEAKVLQVFLTDIITEAEVMIHFSPAFDIQLERAVDKFMLEKILTLAQSSAAQLAPKILAKQLKENVSRNQSHTLLSIVTIPIGSQDSLWPISPSATTMTSYLTSSTCSQEKQKQVWQV